MTSQQGVLFDLDGVVVMSEHLKAQSHSATVTAFGGDVPPEFYATIMGQSHDVVRRAFIGASGKSIDPNAYSDVYESDLHTRMRSDIRAAEGAPALLASLNEHNYALALVTSSLTWMMDLALSMTQTGQHFHTKICADDVQRHKPAPDAYLLALERLQLTRQAAVVVEDSQTGIAAAKAAKLPVIAIRHDFNGRHDFSAADQVIDSLTDTDAVLELIESLLAGK